MLMAGAAQSAGIVVRYALCPLATPAQFQGDGGEDAVAVFLKRIGKARCEASEVREIGKEMGDVLPRIRRVTESVVAAASLARRGGFGHWFTMEDLVAGQWAVDRGKGIGIVAVAGFAEGVIACSW